MTEIQEFASITDDESDVIATATRGGLNRGEAEIDSLVERGFIHHSVGANGGMTLALSDKGYRYVGWLLG